MGYNRLVIIIPESSYNEGWGLVATKIEEFITEKTSTPGAFITNGGTTEHLLNEKGSFKDALNKSKWTLKEAEVTEVDVVKNQLSVKTQEADNDLLHRCLVGRVNGGDEVPTRNEVRRWAQQTWKGTQNIQVYDMNGFQFLFEFQSRKAAEHFLMGDWRRQGVILTLDWWSPTKGSFPIQTKFDWFWIRVHGLPLHLWSTSVMKEIGDKCGGWLENEEETELKNHLRWARIRVKGPREAIPLSIDVDDGNLIFSMPIWVESPAMYKKKEIVTNPRQVTIAGKGEPRVVLGCGKYKKTFHEKGKEVVGLYPTDFVGSDTQQVVSALEQVACSSAECLNLQESVGPDPILLNSTLPPDMDQPESPFGTIHLTPRPKPTSEPFIEPIGSQEPYQEEDRLLFQKSTDEMSFLIKKSNGFTKPFTNSILRESGKSEKIFEHSSIDEDTEFCMRMETTPKNFQSLSIDNLQIKESKETSNLVSSQMDSIKGIDSEREEGVIELFGEQMVEYEDPKPLAMDDSIVED